MTERALLDAVRDACRWSGLLCYHTYSSRRSERGFPDLVVVGRNGILFRELKADRGRLTADQREWLDRLTAAGADATVWRPDDWPGRVLGELAGIGGRLLLCLRESRRSTAAVTTWSKVGKFPTLQSAPTRLR